MDTRVLHTLEKIHKMFWRYRELNKATGRKPWSVTDEQAWLALDTYAHSEKTKEAYMKRLEFFDLAYHMEKDKDWMVFDPKGVEYDGEKLLIRKIERQKKAFLEAKAEQEEKENDSKPEQK